MKRYVFLSVLLLCLVGLQAQQWKNYTCGLNVKCATVYNDTLWVGSEGGVAKFLKNGTKLATYTHADGLAHNIVNNIAVDQQGLVWFGTNGGVSKFDGSNWTTYNSYNSPLPNNSIYSVSVDVSGAKWFSTAGGIAKLEGNNWTIYSVAAFSDLPTFSYLLIDRSYNFWAISNSTSHLYKLTNGSWTDKGTIFGSSPFFDNNNHLWTFRSAGGPNTRLYLYRFDGSNWTTYDYTNSNLPDYAFFNGVVMDKEHNLWLQLGQSGLFKFDGINWSYSAGYSKGNILAIDSADNKWFGMGEGAFGLAKWDGINWIEYNPSASGMLANNVRALAIDKHDNKWVSAYDYGAHGNGGFTKFDETKWTEYSPGTGTEPYAPNLILTEPNDKIWTISKEFDGTNWIDAPYPSTSAYAFAVDHAGVKWFTTEYGVYKYDGTWTLIPKPWFNEVVVDYNNNKWFASWRGVSKFDGNNWYDYDTLDCPTIKYINSLATDNLGNAWFGTAGKGIIKFDGVVWTVYDTLNSGLPNNYIVSISTDRKNNVWLSNLYTGATKFDGTTWVTYNTFNSGLGDDMVRVITEDKQNHIWFGTDGGLSQLLSTDSIYSTWLQFSENICANNTIHLNPVVNYGTPPYTFAWQATGNALSCNNCQNPTATITQNSVYTVLVTDADNRVTADTLHVYACLNTAVNEVENEIAASIYPNPATGMLYVETDGADALTLNIYDLQGRLAISFSHPTTQDNDISHLANGLYVAEILTPAGTARRRLVKM